MELSDKDIQTAIRTIFKMFVNLKEKVNAMRRKMEDFFFKKNQLEVLDMKNKIFFLTQRCLWVRLT